MNINLSKQITIELEDIQPLDSGSVKHKSGTLEALFNIFNSNLGASILALPFAMKFCGMGYGILIQLFSAIFMLYGVNKLIKIVDQLNIPGILYPDLVSIVLGNFMGKVTQILLGSLSFGACVAYLIFFHQFVDEALQFAGYILNDFQILTIIAIFLFPFIFVKNFHMLNKVSAVAMFMMLFSIVYIFYYDSIYIHTHSFNKFEENHEQEQFTQKLFISNGIPYFIGVALFSIEGISCAFHIRESMKKPKKFYKYFSNIVLLVMLLYIIFAVLNLSTFKSHTQEIILMNIPYDSIPSFLAKISFAVGLILSFPLQAYPIYNMLEKSILGQKKYESLDELQESQKKKIYMLRSCVILVIMIISQMIPQFSALINFIGSVSGIIIQFIIPLAVSHMHNKHQRAFVKIFDLSLFLISSVLCVYSGTVSLQNIFK